MLNLSEIFYSIQGESSFSGLPCIFIRLAGCNLRCAYCDSQYSYTTNLKMEIAEIISEIKKYEPVKLVEVTGGEPLLQNEVGQLLDELVKLEYRVLLETNGSIDLSQINPEVIKIVDIKCPCSGCSHSFLENNLKFLNRSKDEVKFILADRSDYDWAKQKIMDFELADHKLIFAPVFSVLDPQALAEWIIRDRIKVRMQIQLHKQIWDPDTRGV